MDEAKFPSCQNNLWNRELKSSTFWYFCDLGVGDANVGDPLQVGESAVVDSCALQRVGAELWRGKRKGKSEKKSIE